MLGTVLLAFICLQIVIGYSLFDHLMKLPDALVRGRASVSLAEALQVSLEGDMAEHKTQLMQLHDNKTTPFLNIGITPDFIVHKGTCSD